MGNEILPPPSGNSGMNSLYESTRKRKLTAADQQENYQTLNTAASSFATAALVTFAYTEHATENKRSLQNSMAVAEGALGLCPSDKLREDVQGYGDGNTQVMKKTIGSNLNSSLLQRLSPKNGDSLADVVKNDQRGENIFASSKSSYKKSIPLTGNQAPTTPEKLWDGSLQLNSSVTVSAVAFFKSGEKMRDVNWSNLAEVIGKVRLDAFERYIQDLSRSRNRGLMVISLCWKEGSSESELLAMKKVAKGYSEGERVGFVQLSPGIDLYVCPRSDAIITILAKHGFFKGMAAAVDNKDSFIGCVVWRKNKTSTNSATKESDRKYCSSKLPVHSSSSQSSAEKDLSGAQPIEESIPVESEAKSSTHESAGNSRNEVKQLKDNEIKLRMCNSSASANLSPRSSVRMPETFSDSNCAIHSASLRGSMTQLFKDEAPPIHKSGIQKPELSLELQKPYLPLPSNVIKQPTATLDDDDLPEFDFGTACGVSHTPMSENVDAVRVDKKILVKALRKKDGSMLPIVPTGQSLPTRNEQRSENFNHVMFPPNDINGMPLLKKVYEHEEPQTIRGRGVMMPVSGTAVMVKNRFNGSNDGVMPEWRPPNGNPCNFLLPQITSPSTACVPSRVPNSRFGSFSNSNSRPSPLLGAHPPFSTHTFHPENHLSIDTTMKMVQPRIPDGYLHRGPSSSLVFDANPLSRPPANTFAVKVPVPPKGWRSWMP